uniref:RNA-directed DNA polymerase n=1 Tax=Bracon brevicornis TaxID=1563983 RepID=A0A6V7L5H4_9HYME
MTNYYAKFVKDYATIVAPLYELLKRDNKWLWSRRCCEAFLQIKRKLISSDVLMHYNPELPIKITCDASPYGLGAVLSHILPNNKVKPIAFNSRTLTKAEKGYAQLDREALAIIFAIKSFHQYIYGRHFLLETDHKPLKFIFGPKKGLPVFATNRIQRWAVFLLAYDFDLVHIRGKDNMSADCLSRLLKLSEEEIVVDEFSYLNYIESDIKSRDCNLIRSETATDPILSCILNYVKLGWPHEVEEDLATFKRREHELSIDRGCLMWGYRVIVPRSLRGMMLRELHSSHMGMVRMKALARSYMWWPNLDTDIETVAKTCQLCMENSDNPPRSAPHSWKWPKGPNQQLHIDFFGPLEGKMYLIIIDAFSKWLDVKEMNNITSKATISALEEYFVIWGYCNGTAVLKFGADLNFLCAFSHQRALVMKFLNLNYPAREGSGPFNR